MNKQEATWESVQDAFAKLHKREQDTILYSMRNLSDGRSRPLSDKAKIEVAGMLGIWLFNRENRQG
jgi:hypothetical protein